jgi:kynureninase
VKAVREKVEELTSFAVSLADVWLAPLGFAVLSPRDPARRGAHVALAHPQAEALCTALVDVGVLADFRHPDVLRLGLAPLSTRFVDVWDALDRLAALARELSP